MSDQENTPVETSVETPVEAPKEAPAKTRQMTFNVLEDGTIRAEFGEGIDPLVLNPAAVPESLQAAAMTEGLISRARGYTSKLTDAARTPANLRLAVEKAFQNLLAGVWKIERAPGDGIAEYPIEVEAAFLFRQMRAKAKGEEFTGTIQDAAESFAKLSDDEKKQLKGLTRYQVAFQEVKAKRAAAKLEALQKKAAQEEGDAGNF